MESNLIALLDAYNAARANTDAMWIHSGESDAAEAAHQAAIAAEDAAVEEAVKELQALEPNTPYNLARWRIVAPQLRERLREIYQD